MERVRDQQLLRLAASGPLQPVGNRHAMSPPERLHASSSFRKPFDFDHRRRFHSDLTIRPSQNLVITDQVAKWMTTGKPDVG